MYSLDILEREKRNLELFKEEYSNRSNLENIEWAIELIKRNKRGGGEKIK